jgi:hypothetical protein
LEHKRVVATRRGELFAFDDGNYHQGDSFIRFRRGDTLEQDALGGARLTIEIGAEFPIGIPGPFESP